ncbi:hypothetical protein BDK51DRAFT_47259 [Blyttiomyces helicus]|uniref:Uncharacterized protein n=1 Tax=Blyttiomyces helicus TaxID=388810 RepID=A0A4P9VX17_9FUNG|nr:hypothetical protein BDK51DRAFT_47259 [Blyttiomyces helicus]|eukprot:RKO82818.1 hypothetical protein BDK51DRAFT_47259 [Blyttiomyces helicus]
MHRSGGHAGYWLPDIAPAEVGHEPGAVANRLAVTVLGATAAAVTRDPLIRLQIQHMLRPIGGHREYKTEPNTEQEARSELVGACAFSATFSSWWDHVWDVREKSQMVSASGTGVVVPVGKYAKSRAKRKDEPLGEVILIAPGWVLEVVVKNMCSLGCGPEALKGPSTPRPASKHPTAKPEYHSQSVAHGDCGTDGWVAGVGGGSNVGRRGLLRIQFGPSGGDGGAKSDAEASQGAVVEP